MRSEFMIELERRSVGGVSPTGAAPPGFGNVERVYPADEANSEECDRLRSELVDMKAAQKSWYDDVNIEMDRLAATSTSIVLDSIARESAVLEQRHAAEQDKLTRECAETRDLCQSLIDNDRELRAQLSLVKLEVDARIAIERSRETSTAPHRASQAEFS